MKKETPFRCIVLSYIFLVIGHSFDNCLSIQQSVLNQEVLTGKRFLAGLFHQILIDI